MAKVKNVVEKAKSMRGKVPSAYNLNASQIAELYQDAEKNDGWFTLISNRFYFGYMQGVKATKAQLKGGAR